MMLRSSQRTRVGKVRETMGASHETKLCWEFTWWEVATDLKKAEKKIGNGSAGILWEHSSEEWSLRVKIAEVLVEFGW